MHFLIMFNSDMTTCYVILVLGWVQGIFIWDFVCVSFCWLSEQVLYFSPIT